MNADQLRGGQLGGEDQIALVLPVLVVDHDDGPARGDLGDRELDGVEPGFAGLLPVRRRCQLVQVDGDPGTAEDPLGDRPAWPARRSVQCRRTGPTVRGGVGLA